MKKLIFSIALLSAMAFVACSDDDSDLVLVNYVNCQICEIPDTAESQVMEVDYEVCVDADGFAYVNDGLTGIAVEYYFELNCANEYTVGQPPAGPGAPGSGGDGEEPAANCVTCSTTVNGVVVPGVEICEGNNGNAFLGTNDTGIAYDAYVDAFAVGGITCE